MNDQKNLWDSAHQKGNIDHYSKSPTSFVLEVLNAMQTNSKILKLGCGVGNDSVAFANAGHTVTATDFSDVAIAKDQERFREINGLNFQALDMRGKFPYEDNSFDVVYARLSLHYFTDEITRKIIKEIYRVLVSGGQLFFVCKSIEDSLYGKGEEIEKDMYENNGHIRHFFSKEYSQDILKDDFEIQKIESGVENFYGSDSAFIKVSARSLLTKNW